MRAWKNARLLLLPVLVVAVGCSSKSPSVSPVSATDITAPTISAPSDDQQLTTLTPTLAVRNGTTTRTGTRTYDFQVATSTAFKPVVASELSVAEGSGGTTSVTLDTALTPSTRYYWRARMVVGGAASDWVIGRFITKVGGYNKAGELYDKLSDGYTVGERVGSTTFIAGKGLRLDDHKAYVRYVLPETVSQGEFSMLVEGLAPNGPEAKQVIFSSNQGTDAITGSVYEMMAQYRGNDGNPPNCIAFKAVWGSLSQKLELSYSERASSVRNLDPSTVYFWKATWTASTFRLQVLQGGVNGTPVFDRMKSASSGSYSPSPHVAFLGSNAGAYGTDSGSFTGAIIRQVWLSGNARPSTINE